MRELPEVLWVWVLDDIFAFAPQRSQLLDQILSGPLLVRCGGAKGSSRDTLRAIIARSVTRAGRPRT